MHPLLTSTIRAYPVFGALAVLVGAAVTFACLRRDGVPTLRLVRILASLALGGLGGAKLWSMLEQGPLTPPGAIAFLDGFRYAGAILGLVLALWFCPPQWTGLTRRRLADAAAIGACFAIATFRIGCFLNGCCSGDLCSLPWCLHYPVNSSVWATHVLRGLIDPSASTSLAIHPLPLYFAGFALALGVVLLRLRSRGARAGQVLLVFLAMDGLGKAVLEMLRAHPAPLVQATSLAIGLTALAVIVTTASWQRLPHVARLARLAPRLR